MGAKSLTMSVKDSITQKLSEAFTPESLDVADESHLHEGHAGHQPGGQTHFRIHIVSRAFEGKSRIDRHRMINTLLATELAGSVHALAMKVLAPGEPGAERAAKNDQPAPAPAIGRPDKHRGMDR